MEGYDSLTINIRNLYIPVKYSTTSASSTSDFLFVETITVIALDAHLLIMGEVEAKFVKNTLSNVFVSFSNANIPITVKTL